MPADANAPADPAKPARAAQRIFDTARELFYRHGIRAVGIDEIVTRAGATKPSLYRSFVSKDELVAAYLRERSDYFWGLFEAAVSAHPGDPRLQLLAFFEALGQRADAPAYRGCGLTNAVVEHPDPAHPGHQVAVAHKRQLRARLGEMTRAMGVTRADELADALLLLIEGAYATSQMFGPGGPARSVRPAAETLMVAYS